MIRANHPLALAAIVVLALSALVQCGSSSSGSTTAADTGEDASASCFPDNDGVNGVTDTLVLTVDETGFSKRILSTQNDSQVTLTLTNTGKKPHGFEVECTSVLAGYPDLPAGCPTTACFPPGSTIAPLAPGASKTVTFDTPTPDGLIYPFKSSEPNDSTVADLNHGQWTLM